MVIFLLSCGKVAYTRLLPKEILKGPSELKVQNLGAQHNYEVKGVAVNNPGAQSYSSGVPAGYQAPVRQQRCYKWVG